MKLITSFALLLIDHPKMLHAISPLLRGVGVETGEGSHFEGDNMNPVLEFVAMPQDGKSPRLIATTTVLPPDPVMSMIKEAFASEVEVGREDVFPFGGFAGALYESFSPKVTSDKKQDELEVNADEKGEVTVHSVCGEDNRQKVTTTTTYPFNAIADLAVYWGDGKKSECTGFFVSKRVILTAGHCVHQKSSKRYAGRIVVLPGRNGPSYPYGYQSVSGIITSKGWLYTADPNYDYAALILPDTKLSSRGAGYFSFANYNSSSLQSLEANVAGYPGDKDRGKTLWIDNDPIKNVTSLMLHYNVDTYGGMSGCPVWVEQGGYRYVVGIHTRGGCPNSAVRVNTSVFNFISGLKSVFG